MRDRNTNTARKQPDHLSKHSPASDGFSRLYINMVACNIVRPLPSETLVYAPNCGSTITSSSTAPNPTTTTAKYRLLSIAISDIRLLEIYLSRHATPGYAPAISASLWTALYTLVLFLDDEDANRALATHDAFQRGCALLERMESSLPGNRTFRRGILAVAWKLGVRIPPASWPALEDLEAEVRRGDVDVRNLTIDFVVSLPRDLAERVFTGHSDCSKRGGGDAFLGLDLSSVLTEWGKVLQKEGKKPEGEQLRRGETLERTGPEGQGVETGRLEEEKGIWSMGRI